MKKNPIILLCLILLLGALFRFYNINWDQGYHLHPDERAIVMAVDAISFPHSVSEFLSVQSRWNPHFFAYGSFPFYLLKIVSIPASLIDPSFGHYDKINLVGRLLSGIFDLGTIFFLFLLGKRLLSNTLGIIAALFYCVSVLPIQLSHFYAVDTLLTFLTTVTLFLLLLFYEKPTINKSIGVGIFFGLALATKSSALVLIVAIGMSILIDFFLVFLKTPHHPKLWIFHLTNSIKKLLSFGVIIFATTLFCFTLFEPYAFIDFESFWLQTMQQSQMTKDAFTFPYTLQYVGKIPYLYEIKNIFLWGQGPIVFILCAAGILTVLITIKKKSTVYAKEIILLVFFLSYFLVVGKFAIGFMRYMLPLYPLLCLFGAMGVYSVAKVVYRHNQNQFIALFSVLFIFILIWPLSFMHIYTTPNTRVLASTWISQNIPIGKTIATEHWDDTLPLFASQNYQSIILTLYDPDSEEKWQTLNELLKQSDYIVIASNRLYVPLQKLTDCAKLEPRFCYTKTAAYYQKLFSEKLGFVKVKEFSLYPEIPIVSLPINDGGADESFTVYDHPKILIFKRQ